MPCSPTRHTGAYLFDADFPHADAAAAAYRVLDAPGWPDANPDAAALADAWSARDLIVGGRETAAFARVPGLRRLLAYFRCEVEFMTFYRLAPGAAIPPHRDLSGNLPLGRLRLHLPVVTDEAVEFLVGGRRVPMRPGQLWALDTSFLHSVANRSAVRRCHLVIGVVVNPWVRARLPPRDLAYYRHTLGFWRYALTRRAANALRRPGLLRQTLGQVAAAVPRLLRGRPMGYVRPRAEAA